MSAVLSERPAAAEPAFREVWLVSLGHALTHWYPATFYILLPLIGAELGLTYSQIGLIMSCQSIAGAVSNIPGGIAVDMVGRKGTLLVLSLFWIGFPYLLMGFTNSYWPLLLCISLVGIGNNLWHPAAIPTLANRFPTRKAFVLSIHGMGGNMGDALAPLAIGGLLALLSWREIVVVNLLPGVVIGCLILVYLGTWRMIDEGKQGDKAPKKAQSFAEYGSSVLAFIKDRACGVLMATSVFRSATQAALMTFLPIFLAHDMGYSPFAVGASLFALQAAGFAAGPIAGHLSDRMGPRRILMSSMGMSGAILLFMAISGASPAFVFFIALLGFFLYATRPVIQAWVLEAAPKNIGGTSIGLMFGFQSLGGAIAPALAGLLADAYGLGAVFYFIAATILIANLLCFAMPRGSGMAGAKPA